jgi:hypothetical protein
MNKKILLLIIGLMCFSSSYSQCAYTGTPLTSVGTYTFSSCIGTPINTANVRAGQYVLVNVLLGPTYLFTIGNLFSNNENLTALNTITTHTTGAFLLNVSNQVVGTGGSETSGATNTNNTFFL